jgi:RHS repeat-associated protein
MAKANPMRWSTQYTDDETDLVMYPRRPYGPSAGRWTARDPVGENGGKNLYGFVGNDPVNEVDLLGEKILNLRVNGKGESEMAQAPGLGWGSILELPYTQVGRGGTLGFLGGIGYMPNWWPFGKGTPYAVGLFKFEAVAQWCIPQDRQLPTWNYTRSNVKLSSVDRKGKTTVLLDAPGAVPDGPTGKKVSILDASGNPYPTGSGIAVYSYDAPRTAQTPNLGTNYFFVGDWNVHIKDSQNAWTADVHIEFSFKDTSPSSGAGKLEIRTPPHEER